MTKTISIIALFALLLNAGCASLPASGGSSAPDAESVSEVEQEPSAEAETAEKEAPKQERQIPLVPLVVGSALLGGLAALVLLIIIVNVAIGG